MNTHKVLRSGKVKRWHNNPDMNHSNETNAAHQWGVAVWVLHLEPNASAALLRAALLHDVGELVAGDLSFDFKRANPTVAAAHAKVETEARNDIIGTPFDLDERDTAILKVADWLAAWDAMCHYQPGLRHRSDWIDQVRAVKSMSENWEMRSPWPVIVACHEALKEMGR